MKSRLNPRLTPLALAATVLWGSALFAPAQAQNPSEPLAIRTQKRVASLIQFAEKGARELGLSAVQQSRLKAIARKNASLAQAIWSSNSLSPTQKMARVQTLKNETSAVFTPAQKQKLAAAKSGALMQLFQTASWVSGELDLTSAQQEKIQGIALQSYRKGSGAAGNFGALRALITDANGQIEATLTASQRAKWSVIKGAARSEFVKNARVLRAMNGV